MLATVLVLAQAQVGNDIETCGLSGDDAACTDEQLLEQLEELEQVEQHEEDPDAIKKYSDYKEEDYPPYRRRESESLEEWRERRAREQLEAAKEKVRKRREEREANQTEVNGFFRRTLGLPLHDIRFTLGLGVFMSIFVFFMNLAYQYEVDRKNDPEGKREQASENHMHSLAALHLFREQGPVWVPLDILNRIENILYEDLYDWKDGYSQDGSLLVDLGFLLRFYRASRRREGLQALRRRQRFHQGQLQPGPQLRGGAQWHADETSILGTAYRVNKTLRSRGALTLRLLVHGPDSKDDVLLDEEDMRVVVDHLTQTLVICLCSSQREEMRDLVSCMARHVRRPETSLSTVAMAPGSEPVYVIKAVAKRLKKLEDKLLRGKVAELIQEYEDFQVQVTGCGLCGSVAVALVAAVYAVPVGAHQEWAFVGDRRKLSALVFGPVPAVAGLQESSEATDRVISFINDADLWPRLTPMALRRIKLLFAELDSVAPASERLEQLLEKTTDPESRDAVRELVDQHSGIFTPVSNEEQSVLDGIPDVRHVGRVIVLQRQIDRSDSFANLQGEDDLNIDDEDEDADQITEEDKDLADEEEEEEGEEEAQTEAVKFGWHEVNAGTAARLSLFAAADCITCHDAMRYEVALKKAVDC
ncbi:Hypothetical Protein FCC1311_055942 [Hondaea fermentalgiana]|uniref:Uncharacterized protein n=1 Tax=Hondaea fermentalgiana TaxID=2315210 RepID=A0A2R5GEM0_9STRA|nr:Hypothetical Protein FCC1311_055942 [Hondaea fermentalgiana]|eukprot:GBG29372.1 Hypothetical Protein FCC1311_055942 [Hondaea fermentalgiana]